MKRLICFLSLMATSVALADDPAELVKLRNSWENSVAGGQARAKALYLDETNKANRLYHVELKQMKDNFMEAKNLQGAIAVDAEIKKLVETHRKMVVKVAEPQEKASPVDGIWICKVQGFKTSCLRILNGDAMLDIDGSRYKCTFEGRDVTVYFSSREGHCEKYKFNPDKPDLMEGVNAIGHKVTLERVKW